MNRDPEIASRSMRVCALTPGLNEPSARFRWRQYLPHLARAGIDARELPSRWGAYPPPARSLRPLWLAAAAVDATRHALSANGSELRFVQREMISTLCTAEALLRRPFVFDVDDAIFLNQRASGVDRIARRASLVICGNEFIAEHFARYAATVVLPTAVDTDRYVPAGPRGNAGRRFIGWSGSSSGYGYLQDIEPALRAVLDRFPDVDLKVVADRPPALGGIARDRVVFQRWSPATEVGAIQDLAVGIMPLRDGAWERGKCSFKMLTYMAVGIPVVVSAVGMNTTVIGHGAVGHAVRTLDDWVDALSAVLSDEAAAAAMGRSGRQVVEDHYATGRIGPRLASILMQQICD